MPQPTAIGDPLTPIQAEVLRYIALHIVTWQRPPTRTEIARRFGWASGNAAQQHVQALVSKGVAALEPATRTNGQTHNYVRILRWPPDVPPVLHVQSWDFNAAANAPHQRPVAAVLRAPSAAPVQA